MTVKTANFPNDPGKWLFLAPVRNVQLTKAVAFEMEIDGVTFITPDRLRRCRKRLGFPAPLAVLDTATKGSVHKSLRTARCLATMRLSGNAHEAQRLFERRATDALTLLALSQLGAGRRRHNAQPLLGATGDNHIYEVMQFEAGKIRPWQISLSRRGKQGELVLDQLWQRASRRLFFGPFMKLLTRKDIVKAGWRDGLRRAALLAGQSQVSSSLASAFLLNMIALESLLSDGGEKHSDAIQRRVESLLGWADDWANANYAAGISTVYQLRNRYVHQGDTSGITMKDLLFTDDLLLNVFSNIARHFRLFQSRQDLIDFSNKVAAEKLLGIKSRVRPKTLTLLQPHYSDADADHVL